MIRPSTPEDFQLISRFESLRAVLSRDEFADRLERPLAYWALPSDRRLPLAFLGRTVGELVATPFDQLSATPGVGTKKIRSLVELLARATIASPVSDANGASEHDKMPGANGVFDPNSVSELIWASWRETVRRHSLGYVKLGRIAPSLVNLPTVIWHTPLDAYVDYTLAELRALKTHGEKRVRAILEVFHTLHGALAGADPDSGVALQLAPPFVPPIEAWIVEALHASAPPTREALQQQVTHRLLQQMAIDAGPGVYRLADARLGVNGPLQTVRSLSRRLGVTRARIYQLLDECASVMNVRWPEGGSQFAALSEKWSALPAAEEFASALQLLIRTFFPDDVAVSAAGDSELA